MYKRIYAIAFIIICFAISAGMQMSMLKNGINILNSEDRESTLESAFPKSNLMKELYGYTNKLISPNEKVSGTSITIKDEDGFLTPINSANEEVVIFAKENILELNEVCTDAGKDFTFVNYPSKQTYINVKSTDYGVDANYVDIRENFIKYLDDCEIDYLDIGGMLQSEGIPVDEVFYKTDHHWNTNAGLYAARAIANYLNNKNGWSLDAELLDEDLLNKVEYEDLWFGETGRSLSLAWVNTLDGFTQIMPKYKTSVSLIYSNEEVESGDFSIMVDESGYAGNNDYYGYSAHYSYSKGMRSPTTYHNNFSNKNAKKILVIKDSFSIVVVPFLTLTTSDITVWDMRDDATKDGLYNYIRENDFDAVILAYTDFWRTDMWSFN